MNARERILKSIAHEEPDRVPIDLGSTPSSGISAIAYNNLKKYAGILHGHTRIYDVVQQLAEPEEWILDRFGVDVLDIGRTFNIRKDDWYETSLADGSLAEYPTWFRPKPQADGQWEAFAPNGTRLAVMPKGATFFDQTCFPYLDGYPDDFRNLPDAMAKVHWAALAHSPWDRAGEPDFWDRLRENALSLRQNSDRALMIVCGCNLFEWGTFLRRLDNFLMDLVTQPTKVEALLDALLEIHLSTLANVCKAVGDVADIIRFGDDLGMNGGPFMSPTTYRQLFKPRHAQLYKYVKQHSQMHTFLHSCGSIYDYLPDLIEIGLEIINPVQSSCRNMEPQRLKTEFGADITFWGGGCDTRTVINRGSPADVRDHVKQRVDILAPGGGFVFCTEHNILPDVPPENILAAFEAVQSLGKASVSLA
ncbi:MAG: methyltransferase [Candidatus Omnitrophota bacterium]|jgi:uroporphyrinogen decarboxylase|nr:MAG: methyltransferase [Candidatus Omnitrophota bacterium]